MTQWQCRGRAREVKRPAGRRQGGPRRLDPARPRKLAGGSDGGEGGSRELGERPCRLCGCHVAWWCQHMGSVEFRPFTRVTSHAGCRCRLRACDGLGQRCSPFRQSDAARAGTESWRVWRPHRRHSRLQQLRATGARGGSSPAQAHRCPAPPRRTCCGHRTGCRPVRRIAEEGMAPASAGGPTVPRQVHGAVRAASGGRYRSKCTHR